jgi:hypothetical protein
VQEPARSDPDVRATGLFLNLPEPNYFFNDVQKPGMPQWSWGLVQVPYQNNKGGETEISGNPVGVLPGMQIHALREGF